MPPPDEIEGARPEPVAQTERMRVLVAEDNPVFQSMLRAMLTRWGYEVVIARDGEEALRALQAEDAPRMAILDWMMPLMDGPDVCRRVRAAGREPYQYVLLLTARAESQDLVDGMESGADDYVTKPFKTHELRVRLRAGRRILDLQEELLRAREALREQATHDALTGLLNSGAILEALHNEADRAERERQPLSLLIADFDHFKLVNDTHGHLAGDAVLREGARRMKSVVRSYDALGRYGGEEFLIVLPGCDPSSARAQAERLREAVGAAPYAAGGASICVTCSVGIASRPTLVRADVNAMIREADVALYTAKARGRNRAEMSE